MVAGFYSLGIAIEAKREFKDLSYVSLKENS